MKADASIEEVESERPSKIERLRELVLSPEAVIAEQCRRSFYFFMHEFWNEVSHDTPRWNWHIEYLCDQLTELASRVASGLPRLYDLIINVPPGTTKSITCSIMYPVWCWTRWPWMRFIVSSYSNALSLEHAEYSRDLVRSDLFRNIFPYLDIKQDKDTKSNFRILEKLPDNTWRIGGNRFSTSVGGALTGFHAHILIVDDPLNPKESVSDLKLATANRWLDQTLSTRKIDKAITPTIMIMQRLHQNDPTGHWLNKQKENVKLICLPGEIHNYHQFVRPVELISCYQDGLLDPVRMPMEILKDLELDLGQYSYAGQIGQNPVPPGGGMFQVDHFHFVDSIPPINSSSMTIRYWDKAASESSRSAFTVGVKVHKSKTNQFTICDVKRGRWLSDERERIMREVAEADGPNVSIFIEQEPGSSGKDSALGSIRNLIGFVAAADRPTGSKISRADPYSAQVNAGNVALLRGDWNAAFIEEHRYFPFGLYKDQVDAASGAVAKLAAKRLVQRIT